MHMEWTLTMSRVREFIIFEKQYFVHMLDLVLQVMKVILQFKRSKLNRVLCSNICNDGLQSRACGCPIPLSPHKLIYDSTCCVWTPVVGFTNSIEWFTVECVATLVSDCTLLYALHWSLWIIVPGSLWAWMMGSSVFASRHGTISIYPSVGRLLVSTIPKTHTSLLVALPRWCCDKDKYSFITAQ